MRQKNVVSLPKVLIEDTLAMATPIKAVPILTGQIAEEFVQQAEEKERQSRHGFSEEKEKRIAEIMRRAREFTPSWME